jgi:hypothetical protein
VSLVPLLDRLVDRLTAALPAGTSVSDVAPGAEADLPRVAVSIAEVEEELVGLGRIPRATQHGALPVEVDIDLANPILDLGGGETLTLVSDTRRVLTLPHGPIVTAEGVDVLPFGPADVVADDGNPFELVNDTPVGRQFLVDPDEGTLRFGANLAVNRTLHVEYFVGQWDTTTTRYQGQVDVAVSSTDPAAGAALARAVAAELEAAQPDLRLRPTSWGAASPIELPNGDSARTQRLGFRFDAELEEPVLTSSGGVISRVGVTGRLTQDDLREGPFDPIEPFDITREGSPT